MNYDFDKLYFSLVNYYDKNRVKIDVHALYKDNESEELIDLDLSKPILPYGYEDYYYSKSLISFSDVLYRTRIAWGSINLKDTLRIKESYFEHYFKFLRDKGIKTLDDLESEEKDISKKKKK